MEITETQTTVKRLGGLPLLGDGVDLLGAHCLADSQDCKVILAAQAGFNDLTVEVVNISIEVME